MKKVTQLNDMIADSPSVSVEPETQVEPKTTEALENCLTNIRSYHSSLIENERMAYEYGWRTLSFAIAIGKELEEAKKLVEYGDWGKWIEEKCPFDIKTSRRYRLLWSHVTKVKDCQSIREAYIRLGLLKMPITEVPLDEVEAVKMDKKEAKQTPLEKLKKYYDDDEKEITHEEHIKTNVVPALFQMPINRLMKVNFSFDEWQIEDGRLVHRDFAIIEGLCNDVTARQLQDDMEPKEEIRLRVKALVKAIIIKMIEANSTEQPPVVELEEAI